MSFIIFICAGDNERATPSLLPSALFVADDTEITAGGAVTFTDLSNNGPDEWLWEKNDGGGWVEFDDEPTVQHPEETFAAGTWSIRLTATNSEGSRTRTKIDYIVASSVPSEGYWSDGYWSPGYWSDGYWS